MSATNRGAERLPRDEYQTPPWAFELLIPYIDWDKVTTIFEPCRGDGNIFNMLPKKGKKRYWAEIADGRDYFKYRPPGGEVDLIVSNPPYSIAADFLAKSLSEARTVAYLLRVNFMGSVDRVDLLNENPPDYQLSLAPRPRFFGGGNDATEYAWIIWDRGRFVVPGTPTFKVLLGPTRKQVPPASRILPPSMRSPERPKRRVRKVK